ncbi:hypothetical protein J2R98_001747 [Alkalibacillus filiformis]|uniref:Lipoprotein n=1 Tax=Alkalibacillus filiformis TaxID=200990 RepID=A0ABU0DTY9_9BACI|nr:hypothetical protein [Alkalibacillus filiformis]MDQ0351915.1 hypothetical protein [Alkalibacillus filiformis]
MVKKYLMLLLVVALLVGCTNDAHEEEQTIEEIEAELLNKSEDVFNNLLNLNWEKVSEYLHQEKGLVYSPYSNVGFDDDLHFDKEIVKDFGNTEEQYSWYWAQNDTEYKDTPNGFIENVIKTRADLNSSKYEVTYGQITFNDSAYTNDTQINTINEEYPEAYYVEYYHEPKDLMEHDGKQQALRFVFEKIDEEWYLIALVRGAHNP